MFLDGIAMNSVLDDFFEQIMGFMAGFAVEGDINCMIGRSDGDSESKRCVRTNHMTFFTLMSDFSLIDNLNHFRLSFWLTIQTLRYEYNAFFRIAQKNRV